MVLKKIDFEFDTEVEKIQFDLNILGNPEINNPNIKLYIEFDAVVTSLNGKTKRLSTQNFYNKEDLNTLMVENGIHKIAEVTSMKLGKSS